MINFIVSLVLSTNSCAVAACCLPACNPSVNINIPASGITITPVQPRKSKQKVRTVTKEVTKEVVKEVIKEVPVIVYKEPIRNYGWLAVAPRAAVGIGFGCVDTSKLLGLRLLSDKLRLGIDVYTMFEAGYGASLLVYPYLTESTRAQINFGVAKVGRQVMSSPEIQRNFDYVAGFGIEQRLIKWLFVTGDYRAALPSLSGYRTSPYLNDDGTVNTGKKYVDVSNTLGNSLMDGQFLVGLMVKIDAF